MTGGLSEGGRTGIGVGISVGGMLVIGGILFAVLCQKYKCIKRTKTGICSYQGCLLYDTMDFSLVLFQHITARRCVVDNTSIILVVSNNQLDISVDSNLLLALRILSCIDCSCCGLSTVY